MKLFDVATSGVEAVKAVAAKVGQTVRAASKRRPGAEESVPERQARINREAAGAWLPDRRDWLDRGL